jgi:hypothetical protein
MATRIKWLLAERAGRSASAHNYPRPFRKCPRSARAEPHSQGVRPFGFVVGDVWNFKILVLDNSVRLDHNAQGTFIPPQCHCPNPEFFDQGQIKGCVVSICRRGSIRDNSFGCSGIAHLIEKLIDAFGKNHCLRLFENRARDLRAFAGLEVKRALSWHPDSSNDESIGITEFKDSTGHAPAPPPMGASLDFTRRFFLGLENRAAKLDRSSPLSLVRETNGRNGAYSMTLTEQGSTMIRWK